MKKILFIFLLLVPAMLLSQDTATIKGRLISEIGNVVPEAYISIVGENYGTASDSLGYFTIKVPANKSIKIRISHSSYQTKNLKYKLSPGQVKKIRPVFKFRVLPTFTVRTQRTGEMTMELIKIDGQDFVSTGNFEARLGSELGVTMNNELSSAFNVRGGNFEENLIYVNDIEVYRPFLARSGQQEGLSFINSSMVEDIQFSAGGFQAKYGDKLSSVLDVTYKKPTKFGGSVYASLLGMDAHLEGIQKINYGRTSPQQDFAVTDTFLEHLIPKENTNHCLETYKLTLPIPPLKIGNILF